MSVEIIKRLGTNQRLALFCAFFLVSFMLQPVQAEGLFRKLGPACESLFGKNQIVKPSGKQRQSNLSDNSIGYVSKIESMRQAYVQASREQLILKSKKKFYNHLKEILKSIFLARKSQDEMIGKFGKDWENLLKDDKLDLSWTKLTDKELNKIVQTILLLKTNSSADIPLFINLSGNRNLSTSSILNLLRSDIMVLGINLHGTEINTSKIISEIVMRESKQKNKQGLRELSLDNVSDADLRMLSHLRNLRELSVDNSIMKSSLLIRLRRGFHEFLETIYKGFFSREELSFIEYKLFHSMNYLTVKGIRDFILSQKRIVASKNGNKTEWNTHLSKITIPVITDLEANREVNDKLGLLFMKKSERPKNLRSKLNVDVELKIAGSSQSLKYKYTYDGDTIWVWDFNNNSKPLYSLRLNGIDTFEVDSKNPIESKISRAAKNFTAHYLEKAQRVKVYSEDQWHHGRKIVDIVLVINGEDFFLSQELIIHGLAIPYSGETSTSRNSSRMKVSPAKLYNAHKRTIDYWYSQDPL